MTNPTKSEIDRAHFSPALLGFYGCCAAVAAGAAMFFFAWFALTDKGFGDLPTGMKIVGAAMMVVGITGSFHCLGKARRPEA